MGKLFKLIIIYFLFKGINAGPMNMETKNWNAAIFDSQYNDNYCFNVVRPLLNHFKCVNKQIDSHDEMKENNDILENELEQDTKTKTEEDLLKAKYEQFKYLNYLTNLKDEKVIEQYKSQIDKLTEHNEQVNNLKDFINSMAEQIGKQFIGEIAKITIKGEQIKNFNNAFTNNLLNDKDEQITELNNAINEKNKQINDLRNQIKEISIMLKEKNKQLIKYNQEKSENIPNIGLYDGVRRIQIAGQPPFEVSYISPLSEWMVIQRRMDGSVDFNRDWEDYKKGFGDVRGEFFLGLRKLHLLTQTGSYELYIQMRDVNGTNKYAHYNNFQVGSEEENYKLISIGSYKGTAGDSLIYHVGDMFSTRDRDNDVWDKSCSNNAEGGWWFRSCGRSILNAKYHKDGIASNNFGICWGTWNNWNYTVSLTYVQMMIRSTL